MAFGKLFAYQGNPRTTAILVVAKANGVELDLVESDGSKPTEEHLKANPLGKIPAFLGEDGYALSEAIAVAIYSTYTLSHTQTNHLQSLLRCVLSSPSSSPLLRNDDLDNSISYPWPNHLTSQNEKTTLLGKTKQDYASILRWMSFVNSEVLPPLGGWFRPLLGRDPYNKKAVEDSSKVALKAVGAIEKHLQTHVPCCERITLADIFAASIISRDFEFFFDQEVALAEPPPPSGSRKYLFGCASVYGETNASVIQGAFVVRGQEFKPVFDVAPDYESYEFTKLDPTKPEDKEFVENMWSWEKGVTVDGKEYPHAAGKVLK
ncbi:elongation factor 1-gamma 2 [Verticillium alfalfae VaMs.102]|uniref:Elongation factor 1-gamma 2 n=1 Tax=Verticillium alfalfae (strain VaMs.102 / ATCC MYA-4576 / FGSC 10136) TaxID=526221 RepID=C9S8J7_VERA1|nr:elongation factor 1-gamma 2 [Verticillium alfalfae VaMs.102]EEY13958.1 elongation factor 1-gamma 2 [Verticillium alfalfae VaMs.102]